MGIGRGVPVKTHRFDEKVASLPLSPFSENPFRPFRLQAAERPSRHLGFAAAVDKVLKKKKQKRDTASIH